ncbi:MAG: hypothetical protein AB7E34_00530 [Acidaminococcaceae bacterium]
MKQGLVYKFLIAPIIFLLLYIGTLLPFIGEGLRVFLQFLPQLLTYVISLLMAILAAVTAFINHFLAFFSPMLAKMFSSFSNAFMNTLSIIFNTFAQFFGFVVDFALKIISGIFYWFGQFWSLLASVLIHLLNLLVFFAEALIAFLLLIVQLLLYALQTLLSTLFAIIYKFLNMVPALRDFTDYLLNTPVGRLLREFFGLFFNKAHRLEAKYAWQNFLKKLKRKGS